MKIVGTTITGSVLVNGNDVTTNLQTLNVWSGSVASTIVSLNTTTSSLNNATASLLNYTASQNNINGTYTTTSSFNAFTASQNNNNSKYATTGSNNFVGTQYVSNTTQATSFIATASLYTDGGLRVGKDAYISGSTYVAGNLVVFGTSSIQYVTSSALIGLEYIDLNTDTPALRYAGIRVYDSGSNVGVTGSLFWDSQTNHWVYANPSGSSYSGGMMISGPRASSLGSEQGTTNNALMRGQGGDHITSSAILDDGTSLRIPYLTIVTGTVGATTFSGSGANLTSIPNAALTNSSVTVTAGTGLSGGGSVSLGSSVTLTNAGVTSIVAGTGISINQGTGAVTVTNTITNNNQLTNGAGYITGINSSAVTTALGYTPYNSTNPNGYLASVGIANMTDIHRLFNNMGQNHGTYQDFNSVGNFGVRYMQGSTNGPQSGQHYGFTLGLGNDYTYGTYGSQFYWLRNTTNPYIWIRFQENGSWGGWTKAAAGVADGITGALAITGAITATGDITAFFSDSRLKKDLQLINSAISKVMSLTGYTYYINDLGKELLNITKDEKQVGLVAQDLQIILPEAVKLAPFDRDEEGNSKSGENYLTIQYEKIVPLLVEAIKEQQSQIEELKAKLG
jgi:hypothetical protein